MGLERRLYRKWLDGKFVTVYRNNPNYPPWHCFTTVRCDKCHENYEPYCEAKHVCLKQNSYPHDEREVEESNE